MTGTGPQVSVLSSGHDVADARLHRLVAALHRGGLSVEVRGLGVVADGPPGATVHAAPRGSARRRLVRAAVLPWQARGQVLLTLDPDLVPSAAARRLLGRRLVVDVHEDYAAMLDDRSWATGATAVAARTLVRLATALAARADLTLVADDHVPPVTARRRLVVRNRPDLRMLPAPAPPDSVPRAVYIGDLRTSRGLRMMVDAVAAAPPWRLDLVGPVMQQDQAWLLERLASEGLGQRVVLHPRMPPERAWRVAAGAWLGLAVLHDTPAFRAAMPSKLAEYLACGVPVAVSPLPRLVKFIDDTGAGVVVDGAESLAATMRGWYSDPAAAAPAREATARCASLARAEPDPYAEMSQAVRLVSTGAR